MAKVEELLVEINSRTEKLERGLKKSQKKTQDFAKSINRLGGIIAAAFSVRAVANFAMEVSKLAGEAEGVENAFRRISDENQLEELRKATRGTVSDLELMKKTVSAANLGLPVKELANLFEFASRRAQETGENVDFLVNSIVTGIGRKSTMILDNLGISATRLKSELGGAGLEASSTFEVAAAVARIANEEMDKMGDVVVTTKDKIEQVKAEWENTRLEIGKTVNAITKDLSPALLSVNKHLQSTAKIIRSESIPWWEKLLGFMNPYKMAVNATIAEVEDMTERQKAWADKTAQVTNEVSVQTPVIGGLTKKIKELKEELEETGDASKIQGLLTHIQNLESELKELTTIKDFELDFGIDNEDAEVMRSINEELSKIDEFFDNIDEVAPKFDQVSVRAAEVRDAAKEMGDALVDAAANSEEGIEKLGATVINTAREMLRAELAKAVAAAISSAFQSSGNPIIGAILAASGAAAAASIFNSAVPKFAKGGMVTGPTLAMVGDNPSGKEAIIPFERMGEFMGNNKTQNINITGEFKLSGRNAYALVRKEAERLSYVQ